MILSWKHDACQVYQLPDWQANLVRLPVFSIRAIKQKPVGRF